MPKQNCWEIKKCGREPSGDKTQEFGICPASEQKDFDTQNSGKNGGRMCWYVTGTFCGGKVQGSFAQKQLSCITCEFFKQVKAEEGTNFKMTKSK